MDEFTRGFIDCALWLADETSGIFDLDSLAEETVATITNDCRQFQEDNAADLVEAGITDFRAGFLFFLNRNRHGSGFWDEGNAPCFTRLSEASHPWGDFDLYVGDDGKVYGQ